jgi:hypothetical protein
MCGAAVLILIEQEYPDMKFLHIGRTMAIIRVVGLGMALERDGYE